MVPMLGIMASSLAKTISDLFTRTASVLGTATSGQAWTQLRGNWGTSGTQATNADSASTYPIGSLSYRADSTMSADVSTSGGIGLAFWVTDANNWWASYPNILQNSSSTCNAGYVSNTSNPPSGSCCSTVNTVAGSSVCDAGYISNTSNPPSGSCCSGVNTVAGSTTCTGSTVSCSDTTNTCAPGGCGSVTSSGYNAYSSDYSTFGGAASVTCIADGGTYSAPNCNFPASWTRTQNTNVTSATTYNCYTSYTTSASTYNCYTSTTTTYTYDTQIKVISSVSGSVVTESTTTLVSAASSPSPVASLKVVTSGGTITTTAYSSANLVSQLGSPVVHNPASPVRGLSVGIVKAPGSYTQGTTLDNYAASL